MLQNESRFIFAYSPVIISRTISCSGFVRDKSIVLRRRLLNDRSARSTLSDRLRHDLITAITDEQQHYKPLDTLQLLATPYFVCRPSHLQYLVWSLQTVVGPYVMNNEEVRTRHSAWSFICLTLLLVNYGTANLKLNNSLSWIVTISQVNIERQSRASDQWQRKPIEDRRPPRRLLCSLHASTTNGVINHTADITVAYSLSLELSSALEYNLLFLLRV